MSRAGLIRKSLQHLPRCADRGGDVRIFFQPTFGVDLPNKAVSALLLLLLYYARASSEQRARGELRLYMYLPPSPRTITIIRTCQPAIGEVLGCTTTEHSPHDGALQRRASAISVHCLPKRVRSRTHWGCCGHQVARASWAGTCTMPSPTYCCYGTCLQHHRDQTRSVQKPLPFAPWLGATQRPSMPNQLLSMDLLYGVSQ